MPEIKRINVITEYTAKTDRFNRATDQAARKTQGLNGFMQQAAATAAGFLAVEVGTQLISGLSRAAAEASRLAAEFEQTQIAFETFLGSASRANEVIADLERFSTVTPFEPDVVIETGRQLLAFGITTENLVPTLERLGNVAAGTNTPLQDLAFVFGQIRTQQVAYTQDLNQFAARGIPIYDELAKTLDTTAAGVKKLASEGKIGFNEINDAFSSLTGEGAKFSGLIQKQSRSIAGLRSTLQGYRTQLLRTFGNALNELQRPFLEFLVKAAGGQEKLSESLRDTQVEFNAQIEAIKEGNFTQEERAVLIDRINKAYGEYLPNLISEKDSIEDITQAQKEANRQFERRILFTAFQEEIQEAADEAREAFNRGLEVAEDIDRLRQRVESDAGIPGGGPDDITGILGTDEERIDRVQERLREKLEEQRAIAGDLDETRKEIRSKFERLAQILGFGDFDSILDQFGSTGEDAGEAVAEGAGKGAKESKDKIKAPDLLPSLIDLRNEAEKIGQEFVRLVQQEFVESGLFPEDSEILRQNLEQIVLPAIKDVEVAIQQDPPLNPFELTDDQKQKLQDDYATVRDTILDVYDAEIAKIDELIAKQEERVERFTEIADKGNAEQLQLEEERLQKLTDRREEYLRRQETLSRAELAISQTVTVAKAIEGAIKAFATNPIVGIVSTLSAIAGVASIINTVTSQFPSFKLGTEEFNPSGKSTADGGHPAILHPKERVVPARINQTLKGISNAELPYAAALYKGSIAKVGDRELLSEIKKNNKLLDRLYKQGKNSKTDIFLDENGLAVWGERARIRQAKRRRLTGI